MVILPRFALVLCHKASSSSRMERRVLITIPFVQPVVRPPSDSVRPVSAWPWTDDCELFPLTDTIVPRSPPDLPRRGMLREHPVRGSSADCFPHVAQPGPGQGQLPARSSSRDVRRRLIPTQAHP